MATATSTLSTHPFVSMGCCSDVQAPSGRSTLSRPAVGQAKPVPAHTASSDRYTNQLAPACVGPLSFHLPFATVLQMVLRCALVNERLMWRIQAGDALIQGSSRLGRDIGQAVELPRPLELGTPGGVQVAADGTSLAALAPGQALHRIVHQLHHAA